MRSPLIGRAVAASLTAHLGLMLVFAASSRVDIVTDFAGLSAPPPTPVEVTLFDIPEETLAPSTLDKAVSHSKSQTPGPASRTAIGESAETSAPVSESAAGESAAGESDSRADGKLAMRGRRSRAGPDDNADNATGDIYPVLPIYGPPEGVSPLKPIGRPRSPESELRFKGGGRYETDGGTFVATARPDGTVDIRDRPNVRVRLNLPDKRFVGALLKSWQADPYAHARGESTVELPTDAIVSGGFDATDAAMRAIGQDPYSAKKLAFLKRTREERAGIALVNRQEALADAARTAKKHLRQIHGRTDLSSAQKRAIYFELWDECSESGSKSTLAATRSVRATVIGFIRKAMPEGSADQFTAAEISELNRRRTSKARFSPYAKIR